LNTNLGVYNGVGKIKIGRRIHNLFRTGAYSNLVERTLLVIFVVLAAAIVLSAGFVAFRFTPQEAHREAIPRPSALRST